MPTSEELPMAGRFGTARRIGGPHLPVGGYSIAWLLALVTYGIGDGVTTMAIVASPHHIEANPLLATAIGHAGSAGVVFVKAVAIGACLALSVHYGLRDGDRLFAVGLPALLVAIGVATTLSNLALLT